MCKPCWTCLTRSRRLRRVSRLWTTRLHALETLHSARSMTKSPRCAHSPHCVCVRDGLRWFEILDCTSAAQVNTRAARSCDPRNHRIFRGVVGQPDAYRLRQRYGAELLVLDVRSSRIATVCRDLSVTTFRICLEKLGVFQASDHVALVIKVFWR